jgi:hypothetical protein
MRNSEFQPNPAQLLRKIDAHWKAKLGRLYGKYFVAPGVRWPSEFNGDGVWDPLPPKKPAASVRFVCEEEWLKTVNGAEFEFRAAPTIVTGPSLMAATAQVSHNSDGQNSEKEHPLLLAEDVEKLISRLDIPHHLRRTLSIWWAICTRPYGREIRLWKGVNDFAQAAQICPRTARYHLRHFERAGLIEIAVDSRGKRLVANTVNRPTTYRLRNETLLRNRWPECKRCGHEHRSEQECGCHLPERRGSFYTKDGRRISKVVGRVCRCKPPFHQTPTPIRPQRSPHSIHHSSPPPQEAAAPQPHTAPTVAPAATPARTKPILGSRAEQRLRELRQSLAERIVWLKRNEKLSLDDAIKVCCTNFGLGREEVLEHLKIIEFGASLDSAPTKRPPPASVKFPGPAPQLALDRDPWLKILRALKANINPHSFETWLKPTRYLGEEDGVLYVRIPRAEFRQMADKYAELIAEAMSSLGMEYREVKFEEAEPAHE